MNKNLPKAALIGINNNMEGFIIKLDFISAEEEKDLLLLLETEQKPKHASTRRNSVRRYGSKKPYNSNMVSESVPEFFLPLQKKLVTEGYLNDIPDAVSVNEYLIGQGIEQHIDSVASGPIISILSLGSDAIMKFEQKEKSLSFDIPARSLIQLKGEARDKWTHGIEPVKNIRYSVVFRCSADKDKKE